MTVGEKILASAKWILSILRGISAKFEKILILALKGFLRDNSPTVFNLFW
jgi:hypothetical protein